MPLLWVGVFHFATALLADDGFYLIDEVLKIAAAMFVCKMSKRYGGRIVFATLTHAMRCQHIECAGMIGKQVSYSGVAVNVLHDARAPRVSS